MKTAITELLGIEIPVIQAPMGYIARAQLASAVSNAGGMGIVETSSGKLDEVKEEIAKMRDLTDRPWGVNIAQMLVSDMDEIVDFVVANQMGTRMLSAQESPVHPNWKQAVVGAAETDTVLLNRAGRPSYRVLRTDRTTAIEHAENVAMPGLDNLMKLYFGGEMEAAFAFSGQVAGRIDEVLSVADILTDAWQQCRSILTKLGKRVGDG